MITPELPFWITQVLAHAETGINILIPLVPRAVGRPAPPLVQIYNSTDDDLVASGAPPVASADVWVLQVGIGLNVDAFGNPHTDLQSGPRIAPLVRQLQGITVQGNSATTLASACRIMRAAERCIRNAFRAMGMGVLLLDGQQIDMPMEMQLIVAEPEAGAGQFDVILNIPFEYTDSWV